jgi:hypothetical protein
VQQQQKVKNLLSTGARRAGARARGFDIADSLGPVETVDELMS